MTQLTLEQTRSMFIKAQPLINEAIKVQEAEFPNFMRDFYNVQTFPLGAGTSMQEITYKSTLPAVERGFGGWTKLKNSATGCDPCDGPDCSYNVQRMGGGGYERKAIELMSREFVSDTFCIKEIQVTQDFEKTFGLIVQNLYSQIAFFKEQNIGFNALTMLAKKLLVDSTGIRANDADPYTYRASGTVRLSALNVHILSKIYETIRRYPDVEPLLIQNGRPVYGLIASDEIIGRIYRDDPVLRQDIRHSSMSDDLVTKYGFDFTIEGKFVPIPYLYPRRFNRVAGELVEVLPWVNGIPLEVGTYTSVNPAYEEAAYEGVLITGMSPFDIYTMPTATSLGEGSEFGPEPSFFDNWEWMNFKTPQDPYGREGYYMTSGTIAISQQFSSGIFELAVERPRSNALATFYPEPICPPTPVDCENEVAAVGCPCPKILGFAQNLITPANYYITLSTPYLIDEETTVLLALSNGGYITADIEAQDDDPATVLEVSFSGTAPQACDIIEIWCVNTLECSSLVRAYDNKGQSASDIYALTLDQPIKAVTAADVVHVYLGDGTIIDDAVVVSVDVAANVWVVDLQGVEITDANCGVIGICVPTATDSSCPTCGEEVTFTACS